MIDRTYKIALIPGDGIGHEVVPAAVMVLEKVGAKHGFAFEWSELSADPGVATTDATEVYAAVTGAWLPVATEVVLICDVAEILSLLVNAVLTGSVASLVATLLVSIASALRFRPIVVQINS